MELRDWLHIQKSTASAFARKLGVTPAYFLLVKQGKIKPGLQLAKQIEFETKGQVTVKELRG